MAILNQGRVFGKLDVNTSITKVPAYDSENVSAYVTSDIIELPKVAEIAFGLILSATGEGTKSVKIELEQSNDGTNFAVPVDVAAISTDWNGVGLFIKNVTPDVTKYARLKYTPLATHSAVLNVTASFNIVQS